MIIGISWKNKANLEWTDQTIISHNEKKFIRVLTYSRFGVRNELRMSDKIGE